MKIIVSPYWNKTIKILLSIDVFVALFAFMLLVNDCAIEGLLILGGYALLCLLITAWIFYGTRRLLTKVVVTELSFESVLINKKQCRVERNKEIYYMIFRCAESVYSGHQFILISNNPFEYKTEEKIFSKKIISYYDIKSQILMPYDDTTSKLFDLNSWKNVGV